MKRFLFLFSFFLLFLTPSFSSFAKNSSHTYNSMISEPPVSDQSGYVLVVDESGGLHTIVWSWSYQPNSNIYFDDFDFAFSPDTGDWVIEGQQSGDGSYATMLPKPSIRISASRGWDALQISISNGTASESTSTRAYWSFCDYYLSSDGKAQVHYYNTTITNTSSTASFLYSFGVGDSIRSAQGYGPSYYSLPSSFEAFNVAWADEERQREYMEEAIDSAVGRLQGTLVAELTELINALWGVSDQERPILEEQVAQLVKLQSYLIEFKNSTHQDFLELMEFFQDFRIAFDDYAYDSLHALNLIEGHIQSIMNMLQDSGDYTDIQDVPSDDVDDLGSAEDDLLGGDTSQYESDLDKGFSQFDSFKSGMSFMWSNVLEFVYYLNDKYFKFFILLLAMGFISLVFGR